MRFRGNYQVLISAHQNKLIGTWPIFNFELIQTLSFLWALLLSVSGVGLIRDSKWAPRLYVGILASWLVLVSIRFFALGTVAKWNSPLFEYFLPVVLFSFWSFYKSTSSPTLGLSDEHLKKIRKDILGTFKLIMVLWLAYGSALLIAFIVAPYLFSFPREISFTPEQNILPGYRNRRLFNYSFDLPEQFVISGLSFAKPNISDNIVMFGSAKQEESILLTGRSIYDLMKGLDPEQRGSVADFARKCSHENFGGIVLLLRSIQNPNDAKGRFDDVDLPDWKGVVFTHFIPQYNINAEDYALWSKATGQPVSMGSGSKAKPVDHEFVRRVLGSLHNTAQSEDENANFHLGQKEFGQGNYEEAKYYFARAYQVRNDAQYAFLLGQCFFSSKQWNPAREWLTNALRIDPQLEQANALLGQIPQEKVVKTIS